MRTAWHESPALNIDRRSHEERVAVAIDGLHSEPDIDEVLVSWRRSIELHGIDPVRDQAPTFLGDRELNEARTSIEPLMEIAQVELDQLYSVVRRAGYSVLLSNNQGITIDQRIESVLASHYRRIGTGIGSVWSEEVEGTNGVGTCLAERRPVVVHRRQHFRMRHTSWSCSAAPIFDPEGELIAVLDISSLDPSRSEHSHALSLPLLEAAVHSLEERLFRDRYGKAWVIALAGPADDKPMALIAVDRAQRIIGADRHTRAELGLTPEALSSGILLSSLFTHDRAPFRRHDGSDSLIQLKRAGSDEICPAIVSAPSTLPVSNLSAVEASLRMRSRRGLIGEVQRRVAMMPPRGGLTAGVLRRVHRHVELHLHENISLDALAQEANLSVHHFARAFKQAVGVPPHRFVLEQRVARAKELLSSTDRSVADVARMVGFADQSHFARHFGRLTGWTPSAFRRAQR